MLAAAVRLHAYFSLGDRCDAIKLLAEEEVRNDVNKPSLPVVSTMESYVWADFKSVDIPLAVPIALHLLWSQTHLDVTASLLRFATSTFLKSSGVDRPSKLFDRADEYHHDQLVYFLRKVCVPNILDVSRVLKSSKEVIEERLAICAALRDCSIRLIQKSMKQRSS